MKSDLDQNRKKECPTNDADNQLLGKRHNYGDSAQPDFSMIAKTIGFSAAEISELIRIYQEKSKGTKSGY